MISVNMSALWCDDTDNIVKGIAEATDNIIAYHNNPYSLKKFLTLMDDIKTVCRLWTGNTYVGDRKTERIECAFQAFFEALMQLLLTMKDCKKACEAKMAKSMLYTGTVYRYLGHNYPTDEVVVPVYNNIYVSWSKNPENNHILYKLYGKVACLSCDISEPLYGIDLDAIGCSRASEHEVVFPTIEKCITEIKYILEENDD